MRVAGVPRTVADVRTARSMPARPGPGGEQDAYAVLGQLARERRRLRQEQDLWQRKLERIATRLAEIDAQAGRLSRLVPPVHDAAPPRPSRQHHWQEIEFPY
jgi:hypothetical protein